MNSTLQTFLAMTAVVGAATSLALHALAKKKNPGCGGDCGCPSGALKEKLKR